MSKPNGALEEAAARIRDERDEIHRAYHEALAALEDALRLLGTTSYAGPAHAPRPGARRAWRQRLSAFAWRSLPILRQQRAFNAALVDTLTRFVGQIAPYVHMRDGELAAALGRLADDSAAARSRVANDAAEALSRLASDTAEARSRLATEAAEDCSRVANDAAEARSRVANDAAEDCSRVANDAAEALSGLASDAAEDRSRVANDAGEALSRLASDTAEARSRLATEAAEDRSRMATEAAEDRSRVANDAAEARRRLAGELFATMGSVSDDMQQRWESIAARERRNETRVNEIRQAATAWRQVTASLRRELERLRAQPAPEAVAAPIRSTEAAEPGAQLASAADSTTYVGFEDRFRGAALEIRARCVDYARYFDGAADVLDVGCGRGEFLDILRGRGITATGVDINPEMVAQCRARGLEVVERDLLAHLASLPDASLGGLFCAQVVEHLEPAYLLKFIDTAFLKLRPGARIVLETINVASWIAFFQSYIRDITHIRPIHPETLDYLVTAGGFQKVEVVYRSPFPPEHRLAKAPGPEAGTSAEDARLGRVTVVFNRNVEQLNRLLYADQDYAVIAERG